jgi:Fe-S cluster assembly protein SufD
MAQVAEQTDSLTPAFDAFRRDPAFGNGSLSGARDAAFARFSRQGFPTTRHEEWRHTNIAPLAQIAFARAAEADVPQASVEPFLFAAEIPHRVVLVNGRWSKALSSLGALPAGVTVRNLRDAPAIAVADGQGPTPFADLNTAFFEDGALIEIAPKTVVAEPLHLVSLTAPGSGPTMVSPRFVVIAGGRRCFWLKATPAWPANRSGRTPSPAWTSGPGRWWTT